MQSRFEKTVAFILIGVTVSVLRPVFRADASIAARHGERSEGA
jgi:hypothetical protein